MSFVYHRIYKGPVKLVIFDWAGTTLDYGCYATAKSGAHYVVESISDVPPVIAEIEQRLKMGDRP